MESTKCPSCNTEGLTGLFCSNCGAKLPVNDETTQDINSNLENNQSGLQDVLAQHDSKQKKKVSLTPKKIYIFFGISAAIILLSLIRNTSQDISPKSNSPEISKTQTEQKETPEDLYSKGKDQFKQGNFKEAELIFKNILDKYPDSNISSDVKKMLDSSITESNKLAAMKEEQAKPPLDIVNNWLTKNSIGTPEVHVVVKNVSSKDIDAFKVKILCYDGFGKPSSDIGSDNRYNGLAQEILIKPGQTFGGGNYAWTLYTHSNTVKVDVSILEVHFTDGTAWKV